MSLEPSEEFLPGQDRPPSRWPVRIGAVFVAVAVVVGAVAIVRTVTADDPVAAPRRPSTSTTASPTVSADVRIVSPSLNVPARVRVAVRAAFPGATPVLISSIVVANKPFSRRYGARTRELTIDILIESDRGANAMVLRTRRSLRLVQGVSGDRVSIRITARRGSTTAEDYLAVERLIRDPRLLAVD